MCVVAESGVAVEPARPGVRGWLVPRPGLFERLSRAEHVVYVSAPAGSGKTFLLRSWIAEEGLGERAAWVSVGHQEHDPQAFWLSVLDSLRRTRTVAAQVTVMFSAYFLDPVLPDEVEKTVAPAASSSSNWRASS
jgi:LuxR family transcriptional regulator, maltose regulon positive regulatory protein